MEKYDVMDLLLRIDASASDRQTVLDVYAETVAAISYRITDDELCRCLIVGAYFDHGASGLGRNSTFAPLQCIEGLQLKVDK